MRIVVPESLPPVKVIPRDVEEYKTMPVEKTHTRQELEALWNAIHYTHNNLQKESLDKMDEEGTLEHRLPDLNKIFKK